MEKTTSLEASKELQDVMPEYTEYWYYLCNETGNTIVINRQWIIGDSEYICKTLTLEEAIDKVPINKWYRSSIFENKKDSESSIEAVEKMLLHLHKQWLLTK